MGILRDKYFFTQKVLRIFLFPYEKDFVIALTPWVKNYHFQ